jgi:transcription antitermination factor NusG
MLASLAERTFQPGFAAEQNFQWRVLRVETAREIEAQRHLERRGVRSYLPTFAQIRRPSRRSHRKLEIVTRSLFPGYVFCAFGAAQFSLTLNSPHVIGLLRFGREDAVIDDIEMQRIQSLTALAAEPWAKLVAGDPIRVVNGPLCGSVGRVIQHKPPMEISIEIQMLGRQVKLVVDGFSVEPL